MSLCPYNTILSKWRHAYLSTFSDLQCWRRNIIYPMERLCAQRSISAWINKSHFFSSLIYFCFYHLNILYYLLFVCRRKQRYSKHKWSFKRAYSILIAMDTIYFDFRPWKYILFLKNSGLHTFSTQTMCRNYLIKPIMQSCTLIAITQYSWWAMTRYTEYELRILATELHKQHTVSKKSPLCNKNNRCSSKRNFLGNLAAYLMTNTARM